MQVQCVDSLGAFDQLREHWAQVHAADAHASVFLSWPWLRGWFAVSPYPWTVLAVRPDDDGADAGPVAFLPISFRRPASLLKIDRVRELTMGGDPLADYSGLLCLPGHEHAAIPALARFIGDMEWDRLRLREIDDPRFDLFLESLPHPRGGGEVALAEGTCCPYIPLPDTWDEYTQQCLGYESRKSLRKKLRKIETDCRLTQLDGTNRDQQIDPLIEMATRRHQDDGLAVENLSLIRGVLQSCADAGVADVALIWRGETPMAGMASLIDAKARSMCFWVTGFDESFAEYSPGRVVNALCIQRAIDRKLKTLDFLRGDEPYKFQFGAQRRWTRNLVGTRQALPAAARMAVIRAWRKMGG